MDEGVRENNGEKVTVLTSISSVMGRKSWVLYEVEGWPGFFNIYFKELCLGTRYH